MRQRPAGHITNLPGVTPTFVIAAYHRLFETEKSVRKLPSGRFQARYQGPDGVDRPAPETSATKTDAEVWLTRTEAQILDDDR
ncbi:hypothetical protein [Nonomuraea angiospora]|uniref:hypothetical protein n=1 Tax=Nonomuraea angiospora TaxID=46172 RepID=UPI0029AD1416|nr:hypothetical protein [Nonomuraea angiospora]MDX3110175.1 hypothetical protein [Nonomuraea angiospora]